MYMKRVLIIKTSSLGDVIHALPVINDIQSQFANAQIDWVVEETFADVPRLHTGVNQVFTVAMRRWRKAIFSQNTWAEIAAFKQLIQQKRYDLIIDAQGLLKSALITNQANGVKHGFDKYSIREPLASCFYDVKHAISYQQHAVTRNRTLAALSLGYTPPNNAPDYGIQVINSNINNAPERPVDIGVQGDYIIALHATSRDSKLWPTENWVDLGNNLTQQGLSLLLPWASEAEFKRANQIASQLQNAKVLPKLSIAKIASVISQAKVAIGVDTGLSHLAAALSVPTIAIYTDTNPALTGVMAGTKAKVVNLGNKNEAPKVASVIDSLATLGVKI